MLHKLMDFPGSSDGKEPAYNVGDLGSTIGWGRFPGDGNVKPMPVFLPGEFHGWRNLGAIVHLVSQKVGYN